MAWKFGAICKMVIERFPNSYAPYGYMNGGRDRIDYFFPPVKFSEMLAT